MVWNNKLHTMTNGIFGKKFSGVKAEKSDKIEYKIKKLPIVISISHSMYLGMRNKH